eukprot:Hpha_TRINITY_DN15783_c2_g2::TRINITY_DN15783_c2_g2_i1::g.38210::m.38210
MRVPACFKEFLQGESPRRARPGALVVRTGVVIPVYGFMGPATTTLPPMTLLFNKMRVGEGVGPSPHTPLFLPLDYPTHSFTNIAPFFAVFFILFPFMSRGSAPLSAPHHLSRNAFFFP